MNPTEEIVATLGEILNEEMCSFHLSRSVKQNVLDVTKGDKKMKRKPKMSVMFALALVLITAGAAIGNESLNAFDKFTDHDQRYVRLSNEAELLQDMVWEIPAEGNWPGMTVIFDQIHFDGDTVAIGLHGLGTSDAMFNRDYDVELDESVLEHKSIYQGDEVDTFYQAKAGVDGPWTANDYQLYFVPEVNGQECKFDFGSSEDYDNNMAYFIYNIRVADVPELAGKDEFEITFVARQYLRAAYLDEDGVFYQKGEDIDAHHASYTLQVKKNAEGGFVQLRQQNAELGDLVEGFAEVHEKKARIHLFLAETEYYGEKGLPWIEAWGGAHNDENEFDRICDFIVRVNGVEQAYTNFVVIDEEAINAAEVEFNVEIPSGAAALEEIQIVPVYEEGGANEDEVLILR